MKVADRAQKEELLLSKLMKMKKQHTSHVNLLPFQITPSSDVAEEEAEKLRDRQEGQQVLHLKFCLKFT